MSVEEQDALIQKQMILNLQLEKMTQEAMGSRVYAPKKPLTAVDQEAIKDYNKQFKITDENGKPLARKKFTSIPKPDLDDPNTLVLKTVDDDKGKEIDLTVPLDDTQLKHLLGLIEIEKEDLEQALIDKANCIKAINHIPDVTSQGGRRREEALIETIAELDDIIKESGKNIDDIADQVNILMNLDDKIREAQNENAQIIASQKASNALKIKDYQDTLNVLNKGAFNTNQIYGETEEEYLKRLSDNAEIDTSAEVKEEALDYVRSRFKENIKELIRSESINELVSNELKYPSEEKEIEIKQIINKKFPLFKQKFIKTYGLNNKEVNASDIVQFIKSFIFEDTAHITATTDNIIVAPMESIYTMENPLTKKKVYFMPILDEDESYQLLWSISRNRDTFKQVMGKKTLHEIKKLTGISVEDLRDVIRGTSPSNSAKYLVEKKGKTAITEHSTYKPYKEFDNEANEEIYGWGIKPEKIPDVVPFGKLKLMLHKLYYKNTLVVKHLDGSNIIGLPNLRVSDEFVKVILNLVKGNKLKRSDIETLKTPELHLYNRLIVLADLHKSHSIDSDKTIAHLKHEMDLLTGEIEAGNDSKEVKKQLHKVVHSLKNFGVINSKEAVTFLKQFNF